MYLHTKIHVSELVH